MIDEEDQTPRFWEPWHPKPGDRVRIRLSECQHKPFTKSTSGRIGDPLHTNDENGKVGTVVDKDTLLARYPKEKHAIVEEAQAYYRSIGHVYDVLIDDDDLWYEYPFLPLAASELELVEEEG